MCQLFGDFGDDLFGQTGDDTVHGGPGDDYLDGGAASALIESYYQAASDPVAGVFLMPLIGKPTDEFAL